MSLSRKKNLFFVWPLFSHLAQYAPMKKGEYAHLVCRLIHGFTGMPVNHATATNLYHWFRIWMCLIATVAAAAAPPFKTVERHVSGTYSNSLAFQVARGVLRHTRAADSVCIFSKPPSYQCASTSMHAANEGGAGGMGGGARRLLICPPP